MTPWEQTLTELVSTRSSALRSYAFLLCGDGKEAEDLVQEALVKTFVRLRAGTDVHSTEGYVRRAILTVYLDTYRRRRRWAAVRHLFGPEQVEGPEAPTATQVDVRAALGRLTPRERACAVLRFYDDLTVPQIAAQLGLSGGAVKRYLSDAMHTLEELLGPLSDTDDGVVDEEIVLVEHGRSR